MIDDPEPKPPVQAGLFKLLALLFSLLFLVPCFMLFRTAAKPGARAAYAASHGFFQMDNEEGALLFQAMQLRRGQSIYHSLDKPPYVAGTYTPLYMALVAAVDDFEVPNFARGRMIVWGAAMGVAALLILLITTVTRNVPVGMLSAFLFLATYEVYRWIAYFRVDFPALFFSLAGLTAVVLIRNRRIALGLGSLLMVAGLLTKQTMLAAPVACFMALLIRDRRDAGQFVLWMLGWGLPLLVFLELLTKGQFLRHTILYNMNTFSESDLRVWLNHVWRIHRYLFLAAVVSLPWIFLQFWQRGDKSGADADLGDVAVLRRFWQPLPIYVILAQWNILGAAKAGSAENYLLEPIVGWSILVCLAAGGAVAGQFIDIASRRRSVLNYFTITVMLAGGLAEARFVNLPEVQQSLFSPYANPSRTDFESSQLVLSRVRKAKNPLAELAIFHLQAGKAPVIQPFIMSELSRQGRWDQADFVNDIEAGKFDVVVAMQDLTRVQAPIEYTTEMLSAFRKAYVLEQTISSPLWTYYFLVPRDDADKTKAINIAMNGS